MSEPSALLIEFRHAFPSLGQFSLLEAQLLKRGWSVRTQGMPEPLSRYLAMMPTALRKDTKLRAVNVLAKATANGDLWTVLQQTSIRTHCQNLVALYDFGAIAGIDPDFITELIRSPPKSIRRDGDVVSKASWVRPDELGGPPALMVDLLFALPGKSKEMPGVRLVATATAGG